MIAPSCIKVFVAVLAFCPGGTASAPPRQTPFQQQLVQNARKQASAASAMAKPQMLGMLEDARFRQQLQSCCPTIAGESAEQLLTRLEDEVRVAELTHNFNANSSGTWEGDINITVASKLSYLPNLWTLMYLGDAEVHSQREEDLAEVGIMGFQAFTGRQQIGNATPPSLAEAIERPVYTTSNLLQLDIGNPTFGDVSLIFTPSYAQPLALMQPVDTGNWEDSCNASAPPSSCSFPYPLNCSAWSLAQGTFDHFTHTLLANMKLFETGHGCTDGMLARYFERLFNSGQPPSLKDADVLTFLEPNLAGTVRYPEGVKLVVAEFPSLFGTNLGAQVQSWCAKWGWVLAWALGPNGQKDNWVVHQRALDPVTLPHTLASHNISISQPSVAKFDDLWNEIGRKRSGLTRADWENYWQQLPEVLQLLPLRAGSCADVDRCVGRASNGSCVCYGAEQGLIV